MGSKIQSTFNCYVKCRNTSKRSLGSLHIIEYLSNFQEILRTHPLSNSSGLIILATLSILLNIYFLVRAYLNNRTKTKRGSNSESTGDVPNKDQSIGDAPNKDQNLNHVVVESNSTVTVSPEEKT